MTIQVFYQEDGQESSKSFIGEGKEMRASAFANLCGFNYLRTERTGIDAPVEPTPLENPDPG